MRETPCQRAARGKIGSTAYTIEYVVTDFYSSLGPPSLFIGKDSSYVFLASFTLVAFIRRLHLSIITALCIYRSLST